MQLTTDVDNDEEIVSKEKSSQICATRLSASTNKGTRSQRGVQCEIRKHTTNTVITSLMTSADWHDMCSFYHERWGKMMTDWFHTQHKE